MNILLITPSIDPKRGGQERHVSNLAYYLKKYGDDVTIITTDKYKPENCNVKIINIDSIKILGLPIINIKFYYQFCKKNNFNICHLHHETLFGELILLLNKLLKLPTITTLHSQMIRSTPISYFLDRLSLKTISILSSRIICLSSSIAIELQKRGLNISKCEIIPNAIDISAFNKKYLNINKNNMQNNIDILFVGRIEERKGIKILIDAMDYLYTNKNNYHLIIIGHGPLENNIKKIIKEKKLESVISLMGYVSELDLLYYYLSAKIVVIPSLYEGVPGVALEALYVNKFLICSNIPGLRELIIPKKNGILVPPNDFLSLAKSIKICLDSHLYLLNCERLNKKIIMHYDWSLVINTIKNLYKNVLISKRY